MNIVNSIILSVFLLTLYLIILNIQRDTEPKIGVTAKKAKELLQKNYYDYVIDVRTNREWNQGRFPGAVHHPLNELYKNVKLYDMNANYLIYCRTGRRAYMGASIMKEMGFKNVHYLKGDYRKLM